MLNTILLAFVMIFGGTKEGTETVKVSVNDSKVEWTGAKVGGSHNGTINLKEGAIEVEDGKLVGGSFVIDMTSITNLDLSGEYKGKLEGHLKSDDFFGVEKFPTSIFTITEVESNGGNNYKVTGDLTIKGITNVVSFPAELSKKGNKYQAIAKITVDRSKYNVKYGSDSFFDDLGDKVIYDDFDLNVTLSAK